MVTKIIPVNSKYVEDQMRDYAIYVIEDRALPHASDGLKAATRRVLWTASDGKKYKSLTLAGATAPLHPHGQPDSAINTLAAYYGNNVPLLKGDGSFGTLLIPNAYGASRYTSVTISKFSKDVLLRDIDIIPMVENYDSTLMEPKHFLPLVPLLLVNPQEGVAVGFASTIFSRNPEHIIKQQIEYLQGKIPTKQLVPTFLPQNQIAVDSETKNNTIKWIFKGEIEILNTTEVIVKNLPYGLVHEDFISRIIQMIDDDKLVKYVDDSVDYYKIKLTFKRGSIKEIGEDNLLQYLGLVKSVSENFTILDFSGVKVWKTDTIEYIQKFTDWRLGWYVNRFERLKNIALFDLQKYKDIIRAIDKNLGGLSKKLRDKQELREFCEEVGIVNVEYIADLPIYRFTEEEKEKVQEKIKEVNLDIAKYNKLLSSENDRRDIYVNELIEIRNNIKKGLYDK